MNNCLDIVINIIDIFHKIFTLISISRIIVVFNNYDTR